MICSFGGLTRQEKHKYDVGKITENCKSPSKENMHKKERKLQKQFQEEISESVDKGNC
jgi:hypothetical protein